MALGHVFIYFLFIVIFVISQLKEQGKDPGLPPKPNPILVALGNLTGDQYVLRIIEKVRSTELEEALLVLPFAKVISLLQYLDVWAKEVCCFFPLCNLLQNLNINNSFL